MQSLLSEWELADPNPDDYRQMLQYLATAAPARRPPRAAAETLNALRLVQMSLEVGTSGSARRPRHQHLPEGRRRGQPLVAMLEQAPAESGVVGGTASSTA